jgi:hypothetical protein
LFTFGGYEISRPGKKLYRYLGMKLQIITKKHCNFHARRYSNLRQRFQDEPVRQPAERDAPADVTARRQRRLLLQGANAINLRSFLAFHTGYIEIILTKSFDNYGQKSSIDWNYIHTSNKSQPYNELFLLKRTLGEITGVPVPPTSGLCLMLGFWHKIKKSVCTVYLCG